MYVGVCFTILYLFLVLGIVESCGLIAGEVFLACGDDFFGGLSNGSGKFLLRSLFDPKRVSSTDDSCDTTRYLYDRFTCSLGVCRPIVSPCTLRLEWRPSKSFPPLLKGLLVLAMFFLFLAQLMLVYHTPHKFTKWPSQSSQPNICPHTKFFRIPDHITVGVVTGC